MKVEFVSFDFFDTLYSRRILNPDSVIKFAISKSISETNKMYSKETPGLIEHIFQLRKKIEYNFYSNLNYKVSLKEIYNDNLFTKEFSTEFSNNLIKNEIFLDMNNLYPRLDVHAFARKMYNSKKKLLLISDTYQSKDFISERLKKDDLESIFSKIFVSSENGLRKDTQEIYRHLLKELSISPETWLHVGDNDSSDIDNAKIFGIQTLKVYKPFDNLVNWYPKKIDNAIENFQLDYMLGSSNDFFQNKSFKKKDLKTGIELSKLSYFDFGYYILGPMFNSYIFEIVALLKVKKFNVIFLSREGIYLKSLVSRFQDKIIEGNILIEYPYNRSYTCDSANSKEIKSYLDELINPDLDFLFIDVGYYGTMSSKISTFYPDKMYSNFFFLKWPQNNEKDSNESFIKGLSDKSMIDFLFRKSSIFEFFLSALLGELVYSEIDNEYKRYDPYTPKLKNIIVEVQSGISEFGSYLHNLGFQELTFLDSEKEHLIHYLIKVLTNIKFVKTFFRNLFILDEDNKLYLEEQILDFRDEPVYFKSEIFMHKHKGLQIKNIISSKILFKKILQYLKIFIIK